MKIYIDIDSSIEMAFARCLASNVKSGLVRLAVQPSELPRLEIDDSHILNHICQACNKLEMCWVLLQVVLPIFFALKL